MPVQDAYAATVKGLHAPSLLLRASGKQLRRRARFCRDYVTAFEPSQKHEVGSFDTLCGNRTVVIVTLRLFQLAQLEGDRPSSG